MEHGSAEPKTVVSFEYRVSADSPAVKTGKFSMDKDGILIPVSEDNK